MKYMSWSFWRFDYAMKEIYDNGDRIYQIGMFDYITEFIFKNPDLGYFDKENVIGVTGKILLNVDKNSTDPNNRESITVWNSYMEWVEKIKKKWPHINWYLSVRNDGTTSAIKYLMDNVDNVKPIFLKEIERIMDENPWCAGIDLDLEHCGGRENADNMIQLIKAVSELVHRKGKLLHYDLPAMNGEYWSVGSENWCSYERLNPYLDSVTIMSYDFAWQGSAPGAISPKWWLDVVYNYVSKSFDKEKVFMGLPGYGYCWQISEYPDPTNTSRYGKFRGHTLKYNELIEWQNGTRSHIETQSLVPFASYIDDNQKCAYMYLHVYDIQGDEDGELQEPAVRSEYNNLRYISTFKKNQEYSFSGIICKKSAKEYTKATGNLILHEEYDEDNNSIYALTSAPPIDNGEEYEMYWGIGYFDFDCPTSDTYEIILDISYTWFDRGKITVSLDDVEYTALMDELHSSSAIRRHYKKVATVNLTKGTHTLKFIGERSIPNALFYGFTVCKKMNIDILGGKARFQIQPQTLIDSNMKETNPKKYKLTFEVLRRNPDYAYIYSDDFRSYVEDFYVFSRYYNMINGRFSAIGDKENPSILIQGAMDDYTEFTIKYNNFPSIYVKSQFLHKGVEVGLIVGVSKIGLRGNNIVIYDNDKEVKVISTLHAYEDRMNELAVRVRGKEYKIWLNGFEITRETLNIASNIAGMYSKKASYECYIFEVRDSYNMYLQESITVNTPSGIEHLGRIERSVVIDPKWNTIYIPDGKEEIETRKDLISDDWDYLHTKEFSVEGNFFIDIDFDDIGFWIKSILLVDSEGASLAYYNDIFSYMYWFNECVNTYGFKGCAIWCTGEENPLIYKYLSKEV